MTEVCCLSDIDDKECYICMENKIDSIFKCKVCKKSLCSQCFIKISSDDYNETLRKVECSFKCPICRMTEKYYLDDFDRKSIIHIGNTHFKENLNIREELKISKSLLEIEKNKAIESNKLLKDNYTELLSEKTKIATLNIKLQEQTILHKDNLKFLIKCIKNQSNNLKFLVEKDKTKTVKKTLLKKLYEEETEISINV